MGLGVKAHLSKSEIKAEGAEGAVPVSLPCRDRNNQLIAAVCDVSKRGGTQLCKDLRLEKISGAG